VRPWRYRLSPWRYPLGWVCYFLAKCAIHFSRVCYPMSPVCYLLMPWCYPLAPVCYPLGRVCYLFRWVCYLLSLVCYPLSSWFYSGIISTCSCRSLFDLCLDDSISDQGKTELKSFSSARSKWEEIKMPGTLATLLPILSGNIQRLQRGQNDGK